MKKIIYILIIGLVCSLASSLPSNGLTLDFPVNEDQKQLIPPITNTVIAGDITYFPAIDPASYTINAGLPVGKTPGSLAARGSAAYTIPLEVPGGTNNLQPALSLSYVSGFADGLMGVGCGMEGLSEISRVNQTIYLDGKAEAIRGNLNDRYALDGNRLLVVNGTYGAANSEYRTEIEEYAKVVDSTGTGSQWFKVYSKSGLVFEYGNTVDSKVKNAAGVILIWKVNKISDRHNNYISFSYLDTDDEHPIGKIEYTGNSSLSLDPFAQVIFNYKNRSDVSTYCYGGKEFTRNILLDNIEIKSNGQPVRKYGLTYMLNGYSQLIKITEFSSQNIALNPTVFAWTSHTPQFTPTYNYLGTDNDRYYVGDFNGDGRDDVVTVPVKTSYSTSDKWKLYLANASGSMDSTTQGDLNSSFEDFWVNDYNGDGMDDLMMQQQAAILNYPNRKMHYFYQSSGNSFNRNSTSYISADVNKVGIVDYNGDAKLEFLSHDEAGNWILSSYTGTQISEEILVPISGQPSYVFDANEHNLIVDFNGDGCSDILALNETGYKIYEFKGNNGALVEICSGTNLTSGDALLLFGDYNGDGRTDIIWHSMIMAVDWYLLLFNGDGFQFHELYDFIQFNVEENNNRVYAREMNGDGKTDVVFLGKGPGTSNIRYNRINIALSVGNSFSVTEHTSTIMESYENRYFNFGDFNGDGRDQFLYKNGNISTLYSFATGTPGHLASTIIDGLGAKTSLTYLPMSNSTVYTRGTGAVYPVSDFSSSMQIVSQITTDNGLGGTTSISYKYEGAKIHQQGKGFLGFSKTTVTNATAGTLTETLAGYHATYYYPQVNTVANKLSPSGTTIETTTNTWTQTVLDATSKRIFPYVQTSVQANALTGHSVTTAISSFDSYGNPTQMVKSFSNGLSETTVNSYSVWIYATDWLIGRIGSSTVTYSKSGETSVTKSVRYTYSTDGIQKPDYIYHYEGSPLAFSENHDYDSKGNLTRQTTDGTSIGASQTNYTYTANGDKLLTQTDALGHATTLAYDTYGRLYTEKDYLNNMATYLYDTADRVSSVSNTNGGQVTTAYAQTGTYKPALAVHGITQTGNDGSVSTTWYDKLQRPVRSEKKGFGGSVILADTEYNVKGQVYRVSDPYFAGGSVVWVETYTYDSYGRATNIARNTGRNTVYSYNGATVSETTAGKTASKTYAADGTLASATDNGGTINYVYFPDGKAKTITAPGGIVTSMLYADAARNQTQLNDPSAGTISYTYNSLGILKTQTNARNQTNTYNYHADGRINTIVTPEGTTTYTYNTNKQLTGISSPGSVSRAYGYDTKGRVTSVGENIAGSNFSTSFTYDLYGRLGTRTHPSGIVETLEYNSNGYMATISAGGSIRYTLNSMNAREQLTGSTYGSNLTASFGFDTYGYPSSVSTVAVQDYRYVFNAMTGNLTSRQNYLRSKSESFTYDNLDRLLTVAGPQNLTMTFAANGNISTKSDIGTTAFGYGASAGPYALTGASSSTGVIPTTDQTATYTSFEKVNTIAEGVYAATFVYNSGNQRAKMTVTQSGSTILTRWYGGNSYMKETASGLTKEYTYIGGDAYSAPVAAVTQSGTTTYYYLLRDYLGNITHQVNTANVVVAEYNFDAWGRRRSADDWSYTLDGNDLALFADRGFTGHEHLKWFNLVNMNGRMYDPLVGRFLSVDPYIQDPGFTQEYNRYSYCLNNPLKHADPSGYKKAPVKEDAFIMDYANYWNRRMLYGGGSGGFGGPGYGRNGSGLGGVYYDWGSNKHKSTAQGNEEVGWDYAYGNSSRYGREVSAIIYSGSKGKPYQILLGFHYSDGSSFYYSDGSNIGHENIDWKGVTNATIGLVGGMAEMTVGGAATYFSAGTTTAISGPLMVDGGVRTVANAQRLWHYFNGKPQLAKAYPTSLGALAGKGIDMAFGTSIYDVGFGQAVGGWGNDLTSFVVMGGNGAAISNLVNTPSPSSMLNYIFSVGSYPYSMYYNAPTKQ